MLLIYQKNIILFNQIYPLLSQGAKKIKIPIIDTSDFPAIAQKIGVYEKNTDEKKYTYSDCGIFYLPKRPYMLCIMARGDHSTTSNHTREISKIIYDYVESANTYTDR